MKFEIVNHCYRYSRLLAYQLSSLILHPPSPEHSITYSLFCDWEGDEAVRKTVEFYHDKLPRNVCAAYHNQTPGELRNRAIGRNLAAKRTTADWVWFADTDYAFRDTIWADLVDHIEGMAKLNLPIANFIAPLRIRETSWELGDKLIREMDTLAVRACPVVFVPVEDKRVAIGGLQIARGDTVRYEGYAPSIAAKGPSDEWNFRSDIHFRKQLGMSVKSVAFLNTLVRIRHTNKGYGQPNRHEVVN